MGHIENGIHKASGSPTVAHKIFWYILQRMEGILTNLSCTKYNQINMCQFDVQKYLSYKGWH